MTFDTYPSEWASTRLLIQLPQWIQAGGPAPLKERLADATARDRIRAELRERGAAYTSPAGWADVRLGNFRRPDLLRWESRTVADVMAETGHDAGRRHLRPAPGRGPRASTRSRAARGPRRSARSSPTRSGWSARTRRSSGPSRAPRTYGSFPRILGQFVRDERLLSLELAVHKMTGAAAARLGPRPSAATLRDGALADLVVFDPATVRNNATYDEPRQLPDRHRARRSSTACSSSMAARTPARRPVGASDSGSTTWAIDARTRCGSAPGGSADLDRRDLDRWASTTAPSPGRPASRLAARRPTQLRVHPLDGHALRLGQARVAGRARPADGETQGHRARLEPQLAAPCARARRS